MGSISVISESYFSDSRLSLKSATAGRERWEIKGLQSNKLLAYLLERELVSKHRVQMVTANPVTGRILVLFDALFYKGGVRELIRDALNVISIRDRDGILVDDIHSKNFLADTSSNFSSLLALIKSVDGESVIRREAVTLSALNTTFKITTPLMQGMIMACGLQGGLTFLTALGIGVVPQIGLLAVAYYTSASLEKYLEYKRKQKWTEYANAIESSLRSRSYQHIHLLPMSALAENEWGSTELTHFVKDDTEQVKRFLEHSAPNALDKGLTFTACSVLLLAVSPLAFVLAMAPLPFMYAMSGKFNRKSQLAHKNIGMHKQELNHTVINGINGLSTVKSFTAEEWEMSRLDARSNDYKNSYNNASDERLKHYGKMQFGVYLGISLPVIYSSYNVYKQTISITTFSGIAFLLPQMILSTQGLDQDYAFFQNAASSARKLKYLLDVPQENLAGEPLAIPDVKGEIRFEGVSFRYTTPPKNEHQDFDGSKQEIILKGEQPDDLLVIDNLNLTIPAGSTTAFVGGTGSGKSTLIKLLLRFYEPTKGRILLDGQDIRSINVTDLRKVLGWVSQDVYLFEGTIAENIRYGTKDATDSEIETVAKLAAATDFIEARPGRFNEEVGERGLSLSGGQRQRISVARALLKDAPILILDEATSAVDNLTESQIHREIMAKQADRTLILVAHRLSTVAKANSIYVLENGAIRESGTHKQLLAKRGVYAQLWKLQLNMPI